MLCKKIKNDSGLCFVISKPCTQIWEKKKQSFFPSLRKNTLHYKGSSNTDIAGPVHEGVAVRPQARWLQ